MNLELTVINNQNLSEVYTDDAALETLLKSIATYCKSIALSAESEASRKEISSLAYKIARSKTAIDDAGKSIVEEWKKKSAGIDARRKVAREFLDALKKEISQPLQEYEEREKMRVQMIQNQILEIKKIGLVDQVRVITDAQLQAPEKYIVILNQLEKIVIDDSYAEFVNDAIAAKTLAQQQISGLLTRANEKELRDAEKKAQAQEQDKKEVTFKIPENGNTFNARELCINQSKILCTAKAKIEFFEIERTGAMRVKIHLSDNDFITATVDLADVAKLKFFINE